MVELVFIRRRQHIPRHIEPQSFQRLRRVPVRHPLEPGNHQTVPHFADIEVEPAVARLVRHRAVGRNIFRRIGKGFDPYRAVDALRACDRPDTDPVAVRRARHLRRRGNGRRTAALAARPA